MGQDRQLETAFGPLEERAAAAGAADRISLRGHVVETEIGAFHDEFGARQRLSFDVVVEVPPAHPSPDEDDVDAILSYDALIAAIDDALATRRVELLETLAEDVAARILAAPQAQRLFLRIEKLDRVAGRLGVEIERRAGELPPVAVESPPPQILCAPEGRALPPMPEGAVVLVPHVAGSEFSEAVDPAPEPPATEQSAAQRAARAPADVRGATTADATAAEPAADTAPAGAAAWRIALLALDQEAWRLAHRTGLPVVASRTELDFARSQQRAVIWAPARLALSARDVPPGAHGAALAGWLAAGMGAPPPRLPVPATPVHGAGAPRMALPARPPICGVTLERPRIMGILNITPDSFSDGGDHLAVTAALASARRMAPLCDFLDIGGESTRPGAEPVPEAEEIARILPVIRAIRAAGIATPISIDTRKAAVAAAALDAGADLVNDVSALTWDSAMASLVAERGVPLCLMHAQGDPRVMQLDPHYEDVVAEVRDWLAARVAAAEGAGIARARILVDPGIGFGKTLQHNVSLLRNLGALHGLGCALLLGVSRKRFIGTLGAAPQAKDRMPGSLAAALSGATQGAHVLRVHDVEATRQALAVWQALAGESDSEAAH